LQLRKKRSDNHDDRPVAKDLDIERDGKTEMPSEGLNHEKKPVISSSILEEEIFVQHAGLVLLHPFLNQFFKRIRLLADGVFAGPAEHQKALHLLYFLGTGNLNPAEYELTIAKVLCAYPLQQPVETSVEISEIELNEGNDLLDAAIAQWEILKNSSAAALREGFLQRNGKLFSKNGKLYLQVEQSAIDILLDHLPWNVNMIKLPWMNEMLWVEWR